MTEHQNIAHRIRFDAEDRLPPAYWDRLRKPVPSSDLNHESHNQRETESFNVKKSNIDDWANAPEFIPRHKQSLANSFGYLNPLSTPQHDTGLMFPDVSSYPYPDPHSALMETSYDSGVSYSLPPSTTPESVTMQSVVAPPFNLQPLLNQRPLLPPIGNLNLSMNSDQPFSFVPKGYSANLTAINSGIGPPIAAIVLKKKRKRRPRRGKTAMEAMNTPSEGTYESLRDIQGFQPTPTSERKDTMSVLPGRGSTKSNGHIRSMTSEPDLTSLISVEGSPSSQTAQKNLADSCPDLSATQLELWDNILYKTVMTNTENKSKLRQKARKELFDPRTSSSEIGATSDKSINDRSKGHSESPVMRTSIYELCPFSLYDEDGNNEPFNPSEEQEFIKLMTTSQTQAQYKPTEAAFSSDGSVIVSRPPENASKSIEDSYQIIKKSAAELENLKVKPSNHDNQHFHLTRAPNAGQAVKFDPKTNKYHTALYDDNYEFEPQVEEDYFEGMHIRVNAFEVNNDLTLSESELPQPSRFQQMQWALQRQKEKYVPIEPPERVCCSLM